MNREELDIEFMKGYYQGYKECIKYVNNYLKDNLDNLCFEEVVLLEKIRDNLINSI